MLPCVYIFCISHVIFLISDTSSPSLEAELRRLWEEIRNKRTIERAKLRRRRQAVTSADSTKAKKSSEASRKKADSDVAELVNSVAALKIDGASSAASGEAQASPPQILEKAGRQVRRQMSLVEAPFLRCVSFAFQLNTLV